MPTLARLGLLLTLAAPQDSPLRVSSDFPGGSARVEGVDQETRTIRVSPAVHPDRGWTCWWYFKLEGLRPGETVTLDVGGGVWATPDRAAASLDNREWVHTSPGKRAKDRIVYTHEVKGREAWFAWGPPYVLSHAKAAVEAAVKASPHAAPFEFAKSREGRDVPALRVSQAGASDADRLGIWIEARQHAWEAGSSWVCQGFIDWIVSDDPRAEALRKKALVTIVPVMDADNVERGAGGKEGKPQDHNRDWTDDPHWPEVRAAQEAIRRMNAEGRFDVFIDLHNPAASDREPMFFTPVVASLSDRGRRNLGSFLEAAKAEITGPLRFRGLTRESGPAYDKNWEKISKNWVSRNTRDHVLAVTLETSWNTPGSTCEGYRRVGRELGLAVERALRGAFRD